MYTGFSTSKCCTGSGICCWLLGDGITLYTCLFYILYLNDNARYLVSVSKYFPDIFLNLIL
jgi:hypothetical protein